MRHVLLIASLAALSACSKPAENEPADAATSEAPAATVAAVETPAAGDYDVTGPDGTKSSTSLMADGTYVDRDASGKETAKGKWTVKDGKTCFTPDGKAEECFTESARAADGSFTATDAKGAVVQVKPHTK